MDFLPAGGRALQAHVAARAAPGLEEFQILRGHDWEQRYCPTENGVGVVGPTSQHGSNFVAKIPRGCKWLRVLWYPRCEEDKQNRVTWSCLGASGEKLGDHL